MRTLALDARVLAATNRDPPAMVNAGTFRQDLFFRVSVVSVRATALRERGDDAVLLAERLLADLSATCGRRVNGFTREALDAIRAYAWPGNVRELRNALEHALVLGDGPVVALGDLPETVRAGGGAPSVREGLVALPTRLDRLEQKAIDAALRAAGGNRTKAAAILGINRVTLYKKPRERG